MLFKAFITLIQIGNMEEKKLSEREIQQRFFLYQLLQGQLEELRKHAVALQARATELEYTKTALTDLKILKEGNGLLIPLGSGVYTNGTAVKGQMLVDVGAGIMLKKDFEEVEMVMGERTKEIEGLSGKLQEEMIEAVNRINGLGEELQRAVQGRKE